MLWRNRPEVFFGKHHAMRFEMGHTDPDRAPLRVIGEVMWKSEYQEAHSCEQCTRSVFIFCCAGDPYRLGKNRREIQGGGLARSSEIK